MKNNAIVRVVIGDKVWTMSRKMALATLTVAKQKYEKAGVHAIVGVEKEGIISLLKDTYEDVSTFNEAVNNWKKSGYNCHYTNIKGGN